MGSIPESDAPREGRPTDIIDRAERAIRSWSGVSTREQAADLLDTWKYARDLTPEQRAAVLDRFEVAS